VPRPFLFFDAVTHADTVRSVHTEASAHDQGGRFRLSAPCVALAGTAGAVCASILSFTHPPSCPPSLGTALLSVLLAAHRRCSTMRALTPARRSHARQVSSLTPLCLPDIPSPPTSCASNVAFAVTSARPMVPQRAPGFANPRGLANTHRRIGFVTLRAIRSPPVTSHPASRRRSYLQLHAM